MNYASVIKGLRQLASKLRRRRTSVRRGPANLNQITSQQAGGWVGPKGSSVQALRRQAVRGPTGVGYDPSHRRPQAASLCSLQADRGARSFHKVLLNQERRLGL